MNQECCICTDINNDIFSLLECKHSFHKLCLTEWIKYNSTCPLCRNSIAEKIVKNEIDEIIEELIEPPVIPKNDNLSFGKIKTNFSRRDGYLSQQLVLKVDLPEIKKPEPKWVKHVGKALLKSVEVEIGGRVIQRLDSDDLNYYDLMQELEKDKSHLNPQKPIQNKRRRNKNLQYVH